MSLRWLNIPIAPEELTPDYIIQRYCTVYSAVTVQRIVQLSSLFQSKGFLFLETEAQNVIWLYLKIFAEQL